jgi:hypothetical protein
MPDDVLCLDQQLCFPLYAGARLVMQAYAPVLDELGLTYPQYLVLMVLWEQDGASVQQIGEKLFLDSGTLTPLLQRLAAAGFIRRERSARDERTVENWLTRTLQADGNGTSMEGYRFGSDYWLDFGHPAAVNYVVDLVTRLVERYPVDGIRLDAVQYPEAPNGTASIGYNAVAVARFQARTGQPGVPGATEPVPWQ